MDNPGDNFNSIQSMMNKVSEVAKFKKEDVLGKINNLDRTDRDSFKKILNALDLTYNAFGSLIGMTGGGVSAWVHAKDMDGVPKGRIERVKEVLEGCYYIKQGFKVKPVNRNAVTSVKKSKYENPLREVAEGMVPLKVLQDRDRGDFKSAYEGLGRRLSDLSEAASKALWEIEEKKREMR